MTTALAVKPRPEQRPYEPFGNASEVQYCRDLIVGLDGPAGTGKSRACLEKLHILMQRYAGARGLIVRKTRASLTESALVTWENKVVPADHPMFRTGGQRKQRQHYVYPNKSEVVLGGLDKPERIMSTEFDVIYVQEITECTENDLELLTTRLRAGVIPYQQVLFDCNPQAPTHWIKQRANAGTLTLMPSRHEDNPELWDMARQDWTPRGAQYIAVLDALTGARKERLRYGRWAAAEGMVYTEWDTTQHLVQRFTIPATWPRYLSIDFGFTNPAVVQWWAEDEDGRLYRYRELYHTQTLVEDWAAAVKRLHDKEPAPRAIICDHDAEGRATFERKTGWVTTPAFKTVTEGLQAVQSRLRVLPDGKPRLMLLRDSLVTRDTSLAQKALPCCTEEEIDGYVWDTSNNRKRGEEPVKKQDHGMDALRYMVAHRDLAPPPGNVSWL